VGYDRGQASVEYVGIIAALALALSAILAVAEVPASGLPRAVAGAILPADAGEAPGSAPPPSELSLVEGLMAGELDEFLRYRTASDRDARLDYSTDECSAPVIGNEGASFDFTEACLRHDFGYRNYGRLGLLGKRRRAVDERFLADMQAHCATRPVAERVPCLGWARDFYRGVRAFGWIPASRY
jgi:hypothetical protein